MGVVDIPMCAGNTGEIDAMSIYTRTKTRISPTHSGSDWTHNNQLFPGSCRPVRPRRLFKTAARLRLSHTAGETKSAVRVLHDTVHGKMEQWKQSRVSSFNKSSFVPTDN